jgi:hypothetical protein
MAAGLGFKDFVTGEVLTAADVDGYLMQGIWVFANATARDAAVTSPQEGNSCYLKDTDQVLTYSGSAWVAVGGGSPLTTKGDLYTYSTTDTRIGVGANDTVLTADSSTATGLKWAAAGASVPANAGAIVNTQQNTSSNSYTDLTTAGPSVTVTTGNRALVIVTGQIQNSTASSQNFMSFEVSGATTIAAADEVAVANLYGAASTVDTYPRMSAASYVTLTPGSNTFTAKYRASGGTGFFRNRQIFVINLA